MKRSRARSRKTEEGDGGGEHEEGEDKVDEEEEREGGGAPPAKKAKRARTVVDYEAIVRDDARHVRGVWAETTAQLSQAKGGSASVRVEVEKSLAAFLPRLVRHLRERDVDPAVDARAAQDRRQRELADEEARLAADVLELERQLEDLTSVNLGQRDDLRALAVPSPCDLQQQDQALLLLLSSLPPRASSQVSSPLLPLENALFKPPDGLCLICSGVVNPVRETERSRRKASPWAVSETTSMQRSRASSKAPPSWTRKQPARSVVRRPTPVLVVLPSGLKLPCGTVVPFPLLQRRSWHDCWLCGNSARTLAPQINPPTDKVGQLPKPSYPCPHN